MFIEKRVRRVRDALVRALKQKSFDLGLPYANETDPTKIPWTITARVLLLRDLADIIENLSIEERPEDK